MLYRKVLGFDSNTNICAFSCHFCSGDFLLLLLCISINTHILHAVSSPSTVRVLSEKQLILILKFYLPFMPVIPLNQIVLPMSLYIVCQCVR